MNITYIIPHLRQSSGMERVLNIKANYLADVLGHNVTIITYRQFGAPIFFEFSPKIHFIHLDISDPTFSLHQYSFFKRRIIYRDFIKNYQLQLENFLKNNPQDICISMGIGAEWKFLPNITDHSKKILEFHFNFNISPFRLLKTPYTFKNLKAKLETHLLKKQIEKYDKIVTLTDEDNKTWKKYFPKSQCINNPITINPLKNPNLNNKKVLAVGRLTKEKGFDYLIDTWKIVNQKHPDWELNIYGDGELKDILLKQISNNLLDNKIKLHPPTKEIEKIYHESSIFVLSSRYEGFVLALIEAMASGLPCISFNCKYGPEEMIINAENGFLVDLGNTEDLANKIIALIENPILRKSFSEKAVISAHRFTIEKIMEQWINLFKNILNN